MNARTSTRTKAAELPGSLIQQEPRCFRLLWDNEVAGLRALFESIDRRHGTVLANWHKLYVLRFGHARSLAKTQFLEIFGAELGAIVRAIRAGDLSAFPVEVARTGRTLARMGVPFAELIAVMHLFQEAALAALPSAPQTAYHAFYKLSHCRMIALARAYFPQDALTARAPIPEYQHCPDFHGIVGSAPSMRELYRRIEAVGRTRATVLIVGESGTGKELIAHAIHECGDPRAPFVPLNCAALPSDLIESELFGFEQGAFSGAQANQLGLFRAAQGGTLFLDEITEMSPETQTKLLRAIQERAVRPIGSPRELAVDVRLIASTNRVPEEAVRLGQLREDLYYRLQVAVIVAPPLRDRMEDLPALAQHFIGLFSDEADSRIPVMGVEKAALAAMRNYSWPGNVRELSNAIETAITFGNSPVIRLCDLPESITGRCVGGYQPAQASWPLRLTG